jgi:hypothetical protein
VKNKKTYVVIVRLESGEISIHKFDNLKAATDFGAELLALHGQVMAGWIEE